VFNGKISTIFTFKHPVSNLEIHCVCEQIMNTEETASWSKMSRFFSSQLPGQSNSKMRVFLILYVNSWLLTRFTEEQRSPPKFRRKIWKWIWDFQNLELLKWSVLSQLF